MLSKEGYKNKPIGYCGIKDNSSFSGQEKEHELIMENPPFEIEEWEVFKITSNNLKILNVKIVKFGKIYGWYHIILSRPFTILPVIFFLYYYIGRPMIKFKRIFYKFKGSCISIIGEKYQTLIV